MVQIVTTVAKRVVGGDEPPIDSRSVFLAFLRDPAAQRCSSRTLRTLETIEWRDAVSVGTFRKLASILEDEGTKIDRP